MTKREAIRECKRLGREIEKSGLSKDEFLQSGVGRVWVNKGYDLNCPLCEYTLGRGECKERCPLYRQYGNGCYGMGFNDTDCSPPEWFEAIRNLKD